MIDIDVIVENIDVIDIIVTDVIDIIVIGY